MKPKIYERRAEAEADTEMRDFMQFRLDFALAMLTEDERKALDELNKFNRPHVGVRYCNGARYLRYVIEVPGGGRHRHVPDTFPLLKRGDVNMNRLVESLRTAATGAKIETEAAIIRSHNEKRMDALPADVRRRVVPSKSKLGMAHMRIATGLIHTTLYVPISRVAEAVETVTAADKALREKLDDLTANEET